MHMKQLGVPLIGHTDGKSVDIGEALQELERIVQVNTVKKDGLGFFHILKDRTANQLSANKGW